MTERRRGEITGIRGCMFSGKTGELLEMLTRMEIAGQEVQLFKPRLDDRWGLVDEVKSHSGAERPAVVLDQSSDLFKHLRDVDVVGIDEIQFFQDMIPIVLALAEVDINVVFAGLPSDFRHEPFGEMPELLAHADHVISKTAICTHSDNGEICGGVATRTQRFVDGKPADYNDPVILIGAEESYAARCPEHHVVLNRPSYFVVYEASRK